MSWAHWGGNPGNRAGSPDCIPPKIWAGVTVCIFLGATQKKGEEEQKKKEISSEWMEREKSSSYLKSFSFGGF
jgi:hypothetical protein